MPGAVLNHSRVADHHWPGRDFPDVTIGSTRNREISDVPLRIGVQSVNTRDWVVRDGAECVEADSAIRVVTAPFDHLHRAVQERSDSLCLRDIVLLTGRQDSPRGTSPYPIHEGERRHGLALSRDE